MRVFVAGGAGLIGRRLVPQLVARGHQMTATTTGASKLRSLEQLGADAVVMDGLDAMSVGEAVLNTWTLDILDGRIQAIRTVIKPGQARACGAGGGRLGYLSRGKQCAPDHGLIASRRTGVAER
jgi:NAD(P)-dependent dehydrogenase (short-subunit alcohol dehydrogenase family)